MIYRKKMQAIIFIIPGLLGTLIFRYLGNQSGEYVYSILAAVAYLLYGWGSFSLITGKGYSRWYMLLLLIPFIPSTLIFLFLKDKNKEVETDLQRIRSKRALRVSLVAYLWSAGIIVLWCIMKVFAEPTLSRLPPDVYNLKLPSRGQICSGDISVMGLRIGQLADGINPVSVVPNFSDDHSLDSFSIVYYERLTRVGVVIVTHSSDDLSSQLKFHDPQARWLYSLLYGSRSRIHFFERMLDADCSQFSWVNLLKDIRLDYILIEKAIHVPQYFMNKDSKLIHISTENLNGIMCAGLYPDGKHFIDLSFASAGQFYNVYVKSTKDIDIPAFLSSLKVVAEPESKRINRCYPLGLSRELDLAVRIDTKLNPSDLEEIFGLHKIHEQEGYDFPFRRYSSELKYRKTAAKVR